MKKHRGASGWLELFTEQERSGLTIKKFCESKGIDEGYFYVKRKALRSEHSFVEIPTRTAGKHRGSSDLGTAIRIVVRDMVIEIPADAKGSCLVGVLQALREAEHAPLS